MCQESYKRKCNSFCIPHGQPRLVTFTTLDTTLMSASYSSA